MPKGSTRTAKMPAPASEDWQLGDGSASTNVERDFRPAFTRTTTAGHRHSPLPLVCTLGISLLLHLASLRVHFPLDLFDFLPPQPEPPPPQLAMIELTPEIESAPYPPSHTDETALQALQGFHATALERTAILEQTLANALQQQADAAAARQQQVAALEAAQSNLSGQLEALTAERADLSAQLASERQRRAELERQLRETRQAQEAELAGVRSTYDRLVTALKGEISQKEIALHQAKEKLVVTILDRVLFPSGQATLTPEGQSVMKKVGAILAKVQDRRILIEGHTDNVPIGPTLSSRFPTNWELSTARATEVVKYLINEAAIPAQRLSAVGRADTVPVASNDSEEGRRQNRRIEIILLPPDDILSSVATS